MRVNGGILDKIVFNVKTNNKIDLEYLDLILKQNKSYFEKRVIPFNHDFKGVYDYLHDDYLIFKIDDDIVFIAPNTFENMLKVSLNIKEKICSFNLLNK